MKLLFLKGFHTDPDSNVFFTDAVSSFPIFMSTGFGSVFTLILDALAKQEMACSHRVL